jgi:hypothetical protein
MRVDEVVNAQTVSRSERRVTIDETDFRIDDDSRAAIAATDQIGLATASAEPLEDHSRPPLLPPIDAAAKYSC